jgi:hypothetical protein
MMTLRRGMALLALLCILCLSTQVRAGDAEDKAVEAIKKLGGSVMRDDNAAGKPVVRVDLRDTKATDADLKDLKEFKSLRTLDLFNTKVTDAGLKELKEIKSLRLLYINKTEVTNDAVKELLKALPELKTDR